MRGRQGRREHLLMLSKAIKTIEIESRQWYMSSEIVYRTVTTVILGSWCSR